MANLKNIIIQENGFLRIARGTTVNRSSNEQEGEIRYNTDINRVEIYDGIGWVRNPILEVFTQPGSDTWTAPPDVNSVRLLVVGGGGGSLGYAGGGGAGNVIIEHECPVTPGQTYNIDVGAGGFNDTGSNGGTYGGTGGTSSAFGQICLGGGAGRGSDAGSSPPTCGNGGGGGSREPGYSGTAPNPLRDAVGFGGNSGGNGSSPGSTGSFPTGGGAGAEDNGESRSGGRGGYGGNGIKDDIFGYPLFWAGGGAGMAYYNQRNGPANGYGGIGGLGGAGGGWSWRHTTGADSELNGFPGGGSYNLGDRAEGVDDRRGGDAGPNTGSGGGGSSGENGGGGGTRGGSGIVVIRF